MEIEEIQKIIDWAKEKPTTRKAEINTENGEVSVWVYDKALCEGQIVKNVNEIKIEEKQAKKEKAEYERLKQKYEGGN